MRVEITEDDIKCGRERDPELCPVALAVKRALPNRHVKVGEEYITIEGEMYDAPNEVNAFVNAFDQGSDVWPFEFDTAELQIADGYN